MNRYRLIYTLLLTALMASMNASAGVTVKGNVYGGGNLADVKTNTTVNMGGGTVAGNIYGGGNLGDVGTINDKSDKANYTWTGTDNEPNSSGGANNTGISSVNLTGSTVLIGPAGQNATADKDHGNVFGGGKGDDNSGFYCEKGMVYSTSVVITAGTVKGTVFGGGEVGRVEDNTIVTIGVAGASREGEEDPSTPVINGDVFGAGKGLKTHGYSALVRGNPVVTVQGKTLVGGSVYGGGELASVGKHKVKTSNSPLTPGDAPADLPVGMPYTLANTNLGKCTVTIKDNVTITTNVFGAGQGFDDFSYDSNNKPRRMGMSGWEDLDSEDLYHVFLQTLALATDTHVTIEGDANVNGSVFGGSENGFVQYDTNVTIKNGEIGVDVYGGGCGLTNNTIAGRVNGNTNVHILGGTITRNVYGGAALAKSNAESTSKTATVNLLGGTIGGDAYGGGLGNANTAADVGSTKVNLNGMALSEYNNVQAGDFKTLLSDILTPLDVNKDEDTTDEGIDYYHVSTKGCIVNRIFGANNANGTPLGDVTVHVYATQSSLTSKTNVGAKIVKDNVSLDKGSSEADADYLTRLKGILSDKIAIASAFNDINTSSYDETFFAGTDASTFKTAIETLTTALNTKAATEAGLADINAVRYDMEAVYGGGNEAAYIPTAAWNGTTGSKSQVIIDGCDYTSIEYVYGGGNAAPAPETNVTVNAAYEIYNVFGGGNGRDQLSSGADNPGADVGVYKNSSNQEVIYGTGNATTRLIGGTIHEGYGASNSKGNIKGTVDIDIVTGGYCTLSVGKMVGAGKNADIEGDVKIVMGCKPNEKIGLVFGGADNANVNGDVELTVTSGNFGKIFGGNNNGGRIKGHIILNIEETTCIPLNIDHLYLCGNNAAYSQYGYYVKTTKTEGTPVGDPSETPVLTSAGKLDLIPRESATDSHKAVKTYSYNESGVPIWTVYSGEGEDKCEYAAPILNVISCTSIGEVFGGGYGASATVYGNPTVNINMTPGAHADEIDRDKDGNADGNANALGTIGDVYGGGDAAAVYGNTTVNIGTITSTSVHTFDLVNGEYKVQYQADGVTPIMEPKTVTGAYITGDVYGGGKLADVGKTQLEKEDGKDVDKVYIEGSTFVNIGAVKGDEILDAQNNGTGRYNYTSVSFTAENAPGVTILGNVYGGGKGEAAEPEGTNALPGAFRCGKAMVTKNTNVAIGNGTIGDGNADHGHVYGGGEKGRVQENTTVTIGCENDANSAPVIMGNVFGAGKGVNTHGYSALTRGNSYVTVQGEAKVKMSVYGGGEIASVGKYNVAQTDEEAQEHGVDKGMPYSLANQNSGYCTVIVRDNAVIGPDEAMIMTRTGYPDDKGHVFGAGKGELPYEGYADNAKTWRVGPDNKKQEYLSKNEATDNNEDDYLTYVETLGLATQTYVTIEENAFVKGSVYGGSENGYVQHDTQVNIQGNCQIGNGYVQMDNNGIYLDKLETPEIPMGVNRPYTAAEWAAGNLIPDATKEPDLYALVHDKYYNDHSLPECASWPYGQATGDDKYAPWDKYYGTNGYDSKGGRTTADDGHTFYGNVFGGGSGVIPYRPGKWHPEAGSVGGNTEVNITGGHILTNIYGGNELTDVYGKCTVNFGGTATLGVPRTPKQIAAHPLTCYLFGAGKGDQRVLFNKKTNVDDVEVNITGGWIYGSVFGGGEDGHVHHNVTMTISEADYAANNTNTRTKIGTWGTTYVDGNVFGGGRGFGADAYTAGNVAGTVTMNILGGTMLGSIYGGGRLGSVGYGLFDEGADGYGEMCDDNTSEDSNPISADNFKRGYVYMTIGNNDGTGPIIGNTWEYKIPSASNGPMTTGEDPVPTLPSDIKTWTAANWTTWREYNHVPKTEFEYNESKGYYMLTHTKGGNVFAGGMGNFYKQDGSTYIDGVDWWKLGNVKSTTLIIKGGTIKSNVYGGGELGQVVGSHTTKNSANQDINAGTEITIQGSSTTIGTPIDDGSTVQYTFGSVFGGGYGSLKDEIEVVRGTSTIKSNPKFIAGLVKEDTKIDMQNGKVKASIYGGGEMASVGEATTESTTSGQTTTATGSTYVSVSGGTVGIAPITVSDNKRYFGGAKMGNVYGGGSGHNNTVRSGKIFKNTNVTISGGTIYHSVYGGGAYGTVGEFNYTEDPDDNNKVIGVNSLKASGSGVATVTVTGGIIGYDGKENGMVFGSSRGDINRPGARDDHTAWVYDTHVTIGTSGSNSGPQINGTVYGSGENGHVFNDTEVTINSGTIGIVSGSEITYTENGQTVTKGGAAYPYRGNVYGGGCGTDKYYSNPALETHDGNGQLYNSLAGIVYGNTTVNITGGHVVRNVYGAGAMGSVGKVVTTTTNNVATTNITSGGKTTINISGGTVGVDGNNNGNVFGAARGDAETTQTDVALVQNTSVNISSNATVKGSVYGGGETGDVFENTEVNVCAEYDDTNKKYVATAQGTSGLPTIGGNVYGGGKGIANKFECDKAMVGIVNQGVDANNNLQPGGTTVRIYNGTVGTLEGAEGSQTLKAGTGNVYGGGEIARVERNTVVEIGAAEGTSTPTIRGSVFAAGAGKATHGYSALVRGHSTVTVQGGAKILKNVYGGGELASVGRYKVKTPANASDSDVPSTLLLGMPARLLAGGTSTVNILGSATIGTAGNDETGHVYGAGQGLVPSYAYNNKDYTSETPYATRIMSSKRMVAYTSAEAHPTDKRYKEWDYYVDDNNNEDTRYVWEYFPTKDAYLQFVETLALSAETFVTIGGKRDEATGNVTTFGTPTVKGSVFGGSESGFVYKNTDVKILGGTVHGDAFGGGLGLESFAEAGRVRWNTNLTVSGGAVEGNVYGGGSLGDVGTIDKTDQTDYNYIWKNTDANGNNLAVTDEDHNYENTLGNNTVTGTNKNTGICTVTVSGGTIGLESLSSTDKPEEHGNVYGAGKGKEDTWWCEKAIVYATDVSVTAGTVYGTVYGGGEVGRVEDDAKVTIGTPGETGANKPNITGSVFGGGAGLATHGYSALVRGDAAVTVQGAATVVGNVYGGGEVASVGRFKVVGGLPSKPKGGGTCTVVIKDNAVIGDVYGSCKGVTPVYVASGENRSKSMQLAIYAPGDNTKFSYYNNDPTSPFIWRYYTEDEYLAFLPTLGLASNTHVTIGGSSTVNGSVFGGGQRGVTLGGVDVNITGGTVNQDVYGGGALANSNSSHWHEGHRTDYVELDELYKGIPLNGYYTKSGDDTYTLINDGSTADGDQLKKYYAIFKTNVNLKGGTVNHNVYGGGLGQLAKAAVTGQNAVLYADVDEYNNAKGTSLTAEEFTALSEAEKIKTPAVASQAAEDAIEAKVYGDVSVVLNKPTTSEQTTTYGDCEVKGTIFGCNNLNGSPQAGVDVHVYKTVHKVSGTVQGKPDKNENTYEVTAVYGGGNLAAYYPDDATVRETAKAYVTIDGCELTSIGSVYGGGNAASVPATEVVVNGTYEIGEAFGGGNGLGNVSYDNGVTERPNPGANVGYKNYSEYYEDGGVWKVRDLAAYDTKEERTTTDPVPDIVYGPGTAHATIYGGTVHKVYGGSNTKGNVRVESRTTLDDQGCDFTVTDAYGGGNNAEMDGDAVLEIGCISGLGKAYGGAANADVNGNVVLNITNGTYDQVFGGNDAGGAIRGSITVNIEETGCRPIIIGELYAGGNRAAYSVYGYNDDGTLKKSGSKVADPQVNVKSFTSIGNIFGGGYGEEAVMVGDPYVNINVLKGRYATGEKAIDGYPKDKNGNDITKVGGVDIPSHTLGAIGAINNVFGGGNAAEVIGTPHVNVGTLIGEVITLASKKIEDSEGKAPTDEGWIPSYQLATVEGVDIRGNVYGAGNNADVTGDTEVVIGKNKDVKTYIFTSYGSESGDDAWSSGLAQTTGVTKGGNAEVVILSNGKYTTFVGQKYYVAPNATTDGSTRTALKDENGGETGLWVAISEHKIYNFTSYGASTGGTQYSTGTAVPTGNFKTIGGQEYMQIQVLTNPGYDEWVGRTFYVTTADSQRRQLYKADGTRESVWVEITE